MARVNDLLSGDSRDIVSANVKKLRGAGHPEHVAMHIALKHANKSKTAKRAIDKVKANPKVNMPLTKTYV